jgi:hypothetical protein
MLQYRFIIDVSHNPSEINSSLIPELPMKLDPNSSNIDRSSSGLLDCVNISARYSSIPGEFVMVPTDARIML